MAKKYQSGMTLLELVSSLALLALLMAGAVRLANSYGESASANRAVDQMLVISRAVQSYIRDNTVAALSNATATQPLLISVPMLVAAGYLPSGAKAKNDFDQAICALVLEPSPGVLDAVIVTEGGTAIDDLALGSLADSLGASGGGVYSTSSTVITGAKGRWTKATSALAVANNAGKHCDGTTNGTPSLTAGHAALALLVESTDFDNGGLMRSAVPGQDAQNRMDVPITLVANAVVGNACSGVGRFALTSTDSLVGCIGGAWAQVSSNNEYWLNPDALTADFTKDGQVKIAANSFTGRVGMPLYKSGAVFADETRSTEQVNRVVTPAMKFNVNTGLRNEQYNHGLGSDTLALSDDGTLYHPSSPIDYHWDTTLNRYRERLPTYATSTASVHRQMEHGVFTFYVLGYENPNQLMIGRGTWSAENNTFNGEVSCTSAAACYTAPLAECGYRITHDTEGAAPCTIRQADPTANTAASLRRVMVTGLIVKNVTRQ